MNKGRGGNGTCFDWWMRQLKKTNCSSCRSKDRGRGSSRGSSRAGSRGQRQGLQQGQRQGRKNAAKQQERQGQQGSKIGVNIAYSVGRPRSSIIEQPAGLVMTESEVLVGSMIVTDPTCDWLAPGTCSETETGWTSETKRRPSNLYEIIMDIMKYSC